MNILSHFYIKNKIKINIFNNSNLIVYVLFIYLFSIIVEMFFFHLFVYFNYIFIYNLIIFFMYLFICFFMNKYFITLFYFSFLPHPLFIVSLILARSFFILSSLLSQFFLLPHHSFLTTFSPISFSFLNPSSDQPHSSLSLSFLTISSLLANSFLNPPSLTPCCFPSTTWKVSQWRSDSLAQLPQMKMESSPLSPPLSEISSN